MQRGCHDNILLSTLLEVLRSEVHGLMIKAAEHRNSRNDKCSSIKLALAYYEGIQTRWTKEMRVLYICCSSMDSC
jgi:hypothetical protein